MNISGIFKWHRLMLVAICIVALAVRYWGICWPRLHPDEPTIGSFADMRRLHSHIQTRFYAEGFFTMFRPVDAFNIWSNGKRRDWYLFQRFPDNLGKELVLRSNDTVLQIRKFNAWLAVVNILLLYLLVLSVTESRWAGLLGSAWLALTPLHVENSHYAETDIAAITILTFSLWLWASVLKKGGILRFVFAATATGFAIGTKFTLTPLLFCAIIMSWMPCGDNPRPGWLSGIRRMLAVVLCCVVGVVLANPGIIDWKWFYPHVQSALNLVYNERDGLGISDKWAVIIANWKPFESNWLALGWAWISLVSLGAVVSWRKTYRQFWPVLFVFPFVFFFYFIFIAPWVRGQEFMLFFPSFSIWAGIGFASIAGYLSNRSSMPVFRCGFSVLVTILVLADVAIAGLRRASMFAWPDLRCQALEWFQIHASPDRTVGFGSYTDPAFHFHQSRVVSVGSVERNSTHDIITNGVNYIIRNPVSHGRGTINPATGLRFPQYDKYWEEFIQRSQQLWGWTTLEKPAFFFGCMPVEYWGLIHSNPVVSVNIPLFQPGYMDESVSEGMWLMSRSIGSIKSVEVSGMPRKMVISGPAEPGRSVYLLLQTLDHHATIRVKGLGQSRIVNLAPHSVEVVTLKRPWYSPRLDVYDIIEVYAKPEKYIVQIPCYAQVFVDEAILAAQLIQKGYPDKVLALVESGAVSGVQGKSLWPVFAAATTAGNWTLAAKLHGDARELQKKLREAETNQPAAIEVSGLSGVYYDDHSRVRLSPVKLTLIPDENRRRKDITEKAVLPVRLGHGSYELSFSAVFHREQEGSAADTPLKIRVAGGKPVDVNLSSKLAREVVLPFRVEKESDLSLAVTAECQGEASLQSLELRWRLSSMLEEVDREITRSLSRYELKCGSVADALPDIIERCKLYPEDLVLARLELDALTGAGKKNTEEWSEVLSMVRSNAPCYQLEPENSLTAEIEFYPFFRLMNITYLANEKKLKCSFLVLRDEAPVPRVTLLRRRSWPARWKKTIEQVLSDRPFLFKGEVCSVSLPLPKGSRFPFHDLALSVRTNPKWLQHDYTVAGLKEPRVNLDNLPVMQR